MLIHYIGNFVPPHSTENHVARALENNGHTVYRLQENEPHIWEELGRTAGALYVGERPDFFLWTRTGWDWPSLGLSASEARELQLRFLLSARLRKIPVVGYHLDIWWGLKRQDQVHTEPFFMVDLLVTADGGHQRQWDLIGTNHYWMPPAVSRDEAQIGMYRSDLASPIAFVGNWQGDYHPESAHRHELVRWLQNNYRRDCAFWPRPGEHALRGKDLQDLYASVDVLVGDSCFVGTGLANYWSDRVPETIGRGGYLLHPRVTGLEAQFEGCLGLWEAGDWDGLKQCIELALESPEERKLIAQQGRKYVLEHHTYEVRMDQLIAVMRDQKLLPKVRAKK